MSAFRFKLYSLPQRTDDIATGGVPEEQGTIQSDCHLVTCQANADHSAVRNAHVGQTWILPHTKKELKTELTLAPVEQVQVEIVTQRWCIQNTFWSARRVARPQCPHRQAWSRKWADGGGARALGQRITTSHKRAANSGRF